MLVKQRMHSKDWSQKPFVFTPASRFASLDGKWPKPSVPRDIMTFDQVKELEKTQEKIIAEPWNLQSAALYLSDLIKSSGTVPTPSRQQPLLQCLPGKFAASLQQQIEPDRVQPNQFLPATCHQVTMKSTAAKSKSSKKQEPTADVDMAELPTLTDAESHSPDLPPDEDEEAPVQEFVAKRPAGRGMKRPSAAASVSAEPKAKGKAKAKAKARADPLGSEDTAVYNLRSGVKLVMPVNLKLGCGKCRESHVGCQLCRKANGFVLCDNVWRQQQQPE